MAPNDPVLVVLAAGRGARFAASVPGTRSHKLEQPFGGATVLGCTLRHALQSGLPLVVVTVAALAALAARSVAAEDVVVLESRMGEGDRAAIGMGHSIAAGVAARPHASGWLILPGDMPLVQPGSLREVADALPSHPVVYAQHQGRRGHPVGFGVELFSELTALEGDDGARRLLARYPSHGVELPDDPGVLMDLDTEDDLSRLRALRAAAAPSHSARA